MNSRQEKTGWTDDLSPITGDCWNSDLAAHLLERAGFGGTPEEIEALAAMPPEDAVRHLVYYQAVPDVETSPFQETGFYPPNWTWRGLVSAFAAIQNIPVPGLSAAQFDSLTQKERTHLLDDLQTGVTAQMKTVAMSEKQAVVDAFFFYTFMDRYESARLQSWIAERALNTTRPLQEKLTLFWHSHFAVGNQKVKDYRKMVLRFYRLRALANGTFRDILINILRDPALLIYLDNNLNIKGHPNENFARELMELFTLGRGNFTEQDVKEAARALTGWGLNECSSEFEDHRDLHDAGDKTILHETSNFVGDDLVDIILKQPCCAEFISRKLYRFFVREEITDPYNTQLAALFRSNDYDIAKLLIAIFLSRDFYSSLSCGTHIKSPVELILSTYKKLGMRRIPTRPDFARSTAKLGQDMFSPPNVKGWDGGRAWITPATLIQRGTILRYILFPDEIPVRKDSHLEGSRLHSGDVIHKFLLDLAKEDNFRDFPPSHVGGNDEAELNLGPAGSSANRSLGTIVDYNLSRGIFNGAWMSHEAQGFSPDIAATISVAAILGTDGPCSVVDAVSILVRRFLRVSLTTKQYDFLVGFLQDGIGSSQIDFNQPNAERDILELLFLILSMPEYQLA